MAQRKAIPLRIHPRLYDALRRWAEDEFRSVNGQIEWLCNDALQRSGRLPPTDESGRPSPAGEGAGERAGEAKGAGESGGNRKGGGKPTGRSTPSEDSSE